MGSYCSSCKPFDKWASTRCFEQTIKLYYNAINTLISKIMPLFDTQIYMYVHKRNGQCIDQSLLKFNLKKLGIFKSHSGYTCHFVDLSIPTTESKRWHIFNLL